MPENLTDEEKLNRLRSPNCTLCRERRAVEGFRLLVILGSQPILIGGQFCRLCLWDPRMLESHESMVDELLPAVDGIEFLCLDLNSDSTQPIDRAWHMVMHRILLKLTGHLQFPRQAEAPWDPTHN